MIELVIQHPSIGTIKLTAERQEEMVREAKFWLSLPHACPLCGAAATITHRHVKAKKGENAGEEFDYYYAACAGSPVHESKLGQYRSGGLFYTGEWQEAYQQPQAQQGNAIGDRRAVDMHAALEKAGVEQPTAFARGVLGRTFGTLAELTDAEAGEVWGARPK